MIYFVRILYAGYAQYIRMSLSMTLYSTLRDDLIPDLRENWRREVIDLAK